MIAIFSLVLLALGYAAYQGLYWLSQSNDWGNAAVLGWVGASFALFFGFSVLKVLLSWNERLKSNQALVPALFLSMGIISGTFFSETLINRNPAYAIETPPENEQAETIRELFRFGDIFGLIVSQYVDDVDTQKMIDASIRSMVRSLDPHSDYLIEEDYDDFQVTTSGEFGGVGIEVIVENDFLKVVAPIDDTPAARAGLMSNDVITRVDGVSIKGFSIREAIDLLRGPIGEPVTVSVRRGDNDFDVELIRDRIQIRPVRVRMEGDAIYARLTQFNDNASDALNTEIGRLLSDHDDTEVAGLVLDLRNNPGGLLTEAERVSDLFLDSGTVVSVRSRSHESDTYEATEGDILSGLPIVVLINGGSASASEIVAGALQQNDRATIIGSRSFGKGSVQSIYQLGGKRALKLTTALYYTPDGESIQAKGITPDIEILQPVPEEMSGMNLEVGEARLDNHIGSGGEDESVSGSSVYIPADPKDDLQLQEALEFLSATLSEN